jgi:hypothetical protein
MAIESARVYLSLDRRLTISRCLGDDGVQRLLGVPS